MLYTENSNAQHIICTPRTAPLTLFRLPSRGPIRNRNAFQFPCAACQLRRSWRKTESANRRQNSTGCLLMWFYGEKTYIYIYIHKQRRPRKLKCVFLLRAVTIIAENLATRCLGPERCSAQRAFGSSNFK